MTDEEKRAHRRQVDADRKAYLRSVKRCIRCTKQDAYTLNGRALCGECAEYYRERRREYHNNPEKRERIQAYNTVYQQERKARLKAEGKCVSCGARPAEEGKTRCSRCILRERLRNAERRRREQEAAAWA